MRAECIDLCLDRLTKTEGRIRAILVNSGQANACTGPRGLQDSLLATKALADQLNISPEKVLICSTGVIGEPIPIKNLLQGLGALVDDLSNEGGSRVAKAILTTDLQKKEIAIEYV